MNTEWTLATYKEHMESVITLKDEALRLQALEYERRLLALNHAHEQARQKEATFVSLDKYEDGQRADKVALGLALEKVGDSLNGLSNQIKALNDWRNRASGAAVVLTIFAGAIGAAIARAFGH